jgi:hypothetical protein
VGEGRFGFLGQGVVVVIEIVGLAIDDMLMDGVLLQEEGGVGVLYFGDVEKGVGA